jgi:hypothetical protein
MVPGRFPGSWLGRAASAARLAGDRAEAWPSAAVAVLALGGQLPFLLAVARGPDVADLTVFVVGIASSSRSELLIALVGLVVCALLGLLAAASAAAEVAAQRLLLPVGSRPPARPLAIDAAALLAVRAIAALPTIALLGVALLATRRALVDVVVAPEALGPGWLRAVALLWPWLLALGVAVVVTASLAALAGRYLLDEREPGGASPPGALRTAIGATLRHPVRVLATGAATLLTFGAYLAVSHLLLRVLWAPIGVALDARQPLATGTPLLLVGFVAIWLCCLLAGGVLHSWTTAWWALEAETSRPRQKSRPETSGEDH